MTAHEAQLESALEALARIAMEKDSQLRDAVAEALEQMTAALGDMQAQHAEQYEALRMERDDSRADAARLREALVDLANEADEATGGPGPGVNWKTPLRASVVRARAALASTPSAEPTPRDMRCPRCQRGEPCVFADALRDDDAAAVVTKAVKP